ncbi:pentatricopeptide repeat-containing protein At4g19191, mitochondrial [Malania oleifera]|uniref:pentatricopeptide repeat-containing protein At4g19191, mitochondrial n=1 Tax=Malania oleifera TaxID=397392 RepID=UPI0025AEB39A|nr:pentatricopeptide repeat-containing protein At4g19191, mitochondrial [Malania oleifera]
MHKQWDMLTSSARQGFSRFSNFSAVGLWNFNIREAVNQGQAQKALLLFRRMKQMGLEPNNLTFPFVAKACGKLSSLKYSQIIHTHVVKSPFWSDMYVQTAIVDMYIKCNHLNFACVAFEKMPQRDIASWNAMLVGYAQMGLFDRASIFLHEMRLEGVRPDAVTLIALTQLITHKENLVSVKAVHCFGVHAGIETDVSVANTWISTYAKCGDLYSAEMVFDGIVGGLKTVVSWNSMILGYACFQKFINAVNAYKMMLHDGFRPDASTALGLLGSFVQPEALFQGKLIHCHGIKMGWDMDISVVNTLISMYCKCGDIYFARYLFDSMSERTCISCTAMIGGYAEKGDIDEALALFHAMESAGKKPDLVTVVSLISGCGQTGALELGKWIENYAASNGLKPDVMVCNALIDMYAKCGSINDAKEIFDTMPERTVVSWTTVITGCALNGEFREALDLFFLMVELGLKPNHITFLSVLQACVHAGFLEKGWECFDLMTKVYKVNPGLDHYSCMVDLLGRRGQLKEALEFIQKMPVKPDAAIWGALLGACKIHRDLEMGEYVARHLLELEPQTAVSYVEMANIYASAGRWDGVSKLRKMMKSNRVRKSPGRSLVRLNGKSHPFTVEDRCHPEGLLILGVLDCLALQLKVEEGFASFLEGILEFDFG